MARKNQILINYHTSGLTSMPLASDVELGEIIVRHADERPELLLKTNNGEFAVVPASGAVASAISGAITVLEGNVNSTIADVNEAIEKHVEEFNEYKEDAAAEFATKGELSGNVETLNGNINTAKGEAIAAASAYTDSAVATAKEELEGAIQDVESKVQEANSGTSILEQYVKDTYATSADTEAAIAVAKGEAIAAASAYTDGEIAEVFTSATTVASEALASAKEELEGAIQDVDAKVNELSGATEAFKSEVATTYATSADTEAAIAVAKDEAIAAASAYTDGEIAEVFTSATTVAAEALASASEEIMGEVDTVRSELGTAIENAVSALTAEIEANELTTAAAFNKFNESAGFNENGESVLDGGKSLTQGILDAESHIVEVYASASTFATEAVATAKEELEGAIQDVESKVQEANSGTSILEQYVKDTYATSAHTMDAINVAKNAAIGAASAYTDGEIAKVFTSATTVAAKELELAVDTLGGNIEGVDSKVNTLSSATETFKGEVARTYATSAATEAAIAKAKDEAVAAASAYTDGEIAEVFTSATTVAANALTTAKEEIMGEVEDIESAMNSGFTAIRGELSATTDDLTELINEKVAVAYRYKGSCEYAKLPVSGEVIGEVWNVTDANGNYPAGTNYAWNGSEWDALGGSIDLSPYHKTADFETYVSEMEGELDDIRASISDANSGTSTLEKYVKENYATSAATEAAIAKAKGEAIAAASAYTDGEIAEVYGSATTFATNAISSARTELEGSIADVLAATGDNAEAIKGVKATADTAVQSYSVNCGVKASNNSTVGTFDFSEMVIDGGEF